MSNVTFLNGPMGMMIAMVLEMEVEVMATVEVVVVVGKECMETEWQRGPKTYTQKTDVNSVITVSARVRKKSSKQLLTGETHSYSCPLEEGNPYAINYQPGAVLVYR